MSYAEKDVQTERAKPILLFKFDQGGVMHYYTPQSVPVSFGGHTWVPAVILADKFQSSAEVMKNNLSIRLAITNPLAQTFLTYAPDAVTSVTVYRTFAGETECRVYWKGRVTASSVTKAEVSLECEPIFSALKRVGLRARTMRVCGHALYREGCNLSEADFSVQLTVTAVSKNIVTVPGAAGALTINGTAYSSTAAVFKGGIITAPDGTKRTIANHSGSTLTLMRPLASLATAMAENPEGFTVTLAIGCSHELIACRMRQNVGNYGGFACMPTKNPFTSSMT